MKQAVLCLVLGLAITACGGEKEGGGGGGGAKAAEKKSGVDPANCDKVANGMSAARAKHFNVGGKLPQLAAAVADACRANAWPEAVRVCLAGAKDDASSKACVDGGDAVAADVNKALADQGSTATW